MSGLRARARFNLALLSLACALAVFIWFTASPPEPAALALTSVDIDRVSRVRIQRHGQVALEIRRHDAGWRLTEPANLPAEAARVVALLGLAGARVHGTFPAAGNNLREFGLESPVGRVWFDELELRFGDTEPLNGWRYVLVGRDVHLITDAFFHHLLATPAAFVDAALLGADRPATEVRVREPVLRMLDNRAAELSGSLLRHSGAVHLAAWSAARASAVRTLDPTLPWVDGVEIALGDENSIRFGVADGGHELLFARPDWQIQYHLPREAARRLLLNPPAP